MDNDLTVAPSFGSNLTRKSVVSVTLGDYNLNAPAGNHNNQASLSLIEEGTKEVSSSNPNTTPVPVDNKDSEDNGGVSLEVATSLPSTQKAMKKQTSEIEMIDNITLVLYEFNNVLLTNMRLYDELSLTEVNVKSKMKKRGRVTNVDTIRHFDIHDLMLTFGGDDRMGQLHEHFDFVLETNGPLGSPKSPSRSAKSKSKENNKDNNKENKENKENEENKGDQVLCFLLSNEFDTEMMYEIIRRCKLAEYFQTRVKRKHYMCHVIGKNHFLKKMEHTENEREYLTILKIMHILERRNESVLYIGHNKELIEHLAQINACHTYYVKTPGMTIYDMQFIAKKFKFGDTTVQEEEEQAIDTIVTQPDNNGNNNDDNNKDNNDDDQFKD